MSLQWTTDDDDDEILALHDDRRDSSSSLDRLESAETWQLAGWRTRSYIVLSLFLLSALQAICWNLFAPIFSTVHAVYGWEDTEVEWLANLGNIAMLISLPFTTVIVGALGPRVPTILTAAMMLACTGLRIAPQVYKDVHDVALDRRIVYSLNVMSMLLNGASAAVSWPTPSASPPAIRLNP
jgi:MFS family permease